MLGCSLDVVTASVDVVVVVASVTVLNMLRLMGLVRLDEELVFVPAALLLLLLLVPKTLPMVRII